MGLVIFTTLLSRRVDWLYLIPAGLLVLAWPLCRMPIRYTLRRLAVAEFFILGMALLILLHPSAAPLFLATLAKSNLCVLTLLMLTWTVPFAELLREFRGLGMPAILVTTLALMSRYLPVLAEESKRMQRARASRTFSRRRTLEWKNLTTIIAQLFIRSADRAERIYLAMCARGWK